LRTAERRIRQNFADLWNNDDEATTATADIWLRAAENDAAESNGQH
jgi:hypothetical protein